MRPSSRASAPGSSETPTLSSPHRSSASSRFALRSGGPKATRSISRASAENASASPAVQRRKLTTSISRGYSDRHATPKAVGQSGGSRPSAAAIERRRQATGSAIASRWLSHASASSVPETGPPPAVTTRAAASHTARSSAGVSGPRRHSFSSRSAHHWTHSAGGRRASKTPAAGLGVIRRPLRLQPRTCAGSPPDGTYRRSSPSASNRPPRPSVRAKTASMNVSDKPRTSTRPATSSSRSTGYTARRSVRSSGFRGPRPGRAGAAWSQGFMRWPVASSTASAQYTPPPACTANRPASGETDRTASATSRSGTPPRCRWRRRNWSHR